MSSTDSIKEQVGNEGFAIIDNVFTAAEIEQLLQVISATHTTNPAFRKTADLFAIRQFFKVVPGSASIVFNQKLKELLSDIFGKNYFVVKSIYFDKQANSNWFVSYHQDLTISVDKRIEQKGFSSWTIKQNKFAVQPPLPVLQNNFTIRIHLDNTDEENGALKVIPKSHRKGIYRPETIDWNNEVESICIVKKGGIMFMKPLLLHSSGRTTNNNKRRVIHVECSSSNLPNDLQWAEFLSI